MSEFLTVPSRWHELSDFAFGGVLFLLAAANLFRLEFVSSAELFATIGGLVVAVVFVI